MIEFLSVAEVLQAKCGRRPGFGDKAAPAPQEEQDGVATDLRVQTESSDTRARNALVSWPLGASSCDGRWISLRCVLFLFLRVIPNAQAEVKSVEIENGGAHWWISKV
jgi:hypothetical protein